MRPSRRVSRMKSSRAVNSSAESCSSGVGGRPPRGEDGEQPPLSDAERMEILLEFGQTRQRAARYARNHVPCERPVAGDQTHGFRGPFETLGVAADVAVVVGEPVERDGDRMEPRAQQRIEAPGVERHAVRNHAPRIFAPVELASDPFEVAAHEHLAAREDDEHLVRVDMGRDLRIEHTEEVRGGHIRRSGLRAAVASAVPAGEVAAQRAFPEERTQFVAGDAVVLETSVQLQSDSPAESDFARHDYSFFPVRRVRPLSHTRIPIRSVRSGRRR